MGGFRHRHAHYWGRHGAAGLLLRAPRPDGTPAVLLQHRAPWSHQGGTWGLPGGARDSHETPEQAAVREAHEEAGLAATSSRCGPPWSPRVGQRYPLDLHHGHRRRRLNCCTTVPNRESSELRWVAEDEVAELPLHPGFAASWQRLRTAPAIVPLGPGDQRRRHLPRTVETRGGRFRVVHRGPTRPRAVAAEFPDQLAAASAALSRCGRGARILGGGDRADHHDSARAGRQHFGQPLRVDAADGEPRLVAGQSRRWPRTRSRPGAGRPGLVGVGQHGPTQK